ncbi:hypothetical protein Mapa_006986 [Marchantia paleacea]|nr:hypothetical protein Mapa_006986 [Marchantia paleacea]
MKSDPQISDSENTEHGPAELPLRSEMNVVHQVTFQWATPRRQTGRLCREAPMASSLPKEQRNTGL